MTLAQDRALVLAYLNRSGPDRGALTDAQALSVYRLADGLGDLPAGILSGIGGGWDWSHVAGSSREAWARMALWLRERGHALPMAGGLRAAPVPG